MKLAVVGAGWAGLAAAVAAVDAGAEVTLFEATRAPGGRARALELTRPDGQPLRLDNGQHILIGAYAHTLALMQRLGVSLSDALLALPLALPYPDGRGLQTPAWAGGWPAPLDALAAIATARGWSWGERLALVRASLAWQRARFACAPGLSVAALCARLPARVQAELIEPLCVSALNVPPGRADAQVFLNVMRDALFGKGHAGLGASHLLLPRTDLSALLPQAAICWLQSRPERARLRVGARVTGLRPQADGWRLNGIDNGQPFEAGFDRVIWATAATAAAQAMDGAAADSTQDPTGKDLQHWAQCAAALRFTAITTVYAWAPGARLSAPMLALRPEPDAQAAPAQFVFDRGQLAPQDAAMQGVLAFVASASEGERDAIEARVLDQAHRQLGLTTLQAVQTVTEKRATFACTPGLHRPPARIAPGLWAAGDYVEGPYPATLEGAVRSGQRAAHQALATAARPQ